MYRAQIVLVEPLGPDLDVNIPAITLEGRSVGEADAAARRALKFLQRPPGTAYWLILDERGSAYCARGPLDRSPQFSTGLASRST